MEKIAPSYQKSLRAIGQGLEIIGVEYCEIKVHGDSYVVHGVCKTLKPKEALQLGLMADTLDNQSQESKPQVSGGAQVIGSLSLFEFSGLRFTLNDVRRLELKGQAASVNSEGIPDPHRLSQTLRLAGAYLDNIESHLIRLNWRPGFVTLWRQDNFPNESKDIFTPEILHNLWVHQYKKRKPVDFYQINKTGND